MFVGFTGDTKVITPAGQLPISGLVGQTVTIWNGFEWSDVIPVVNDEHSPIFNIHFTWGRMLTAGAMTEFKLADDTIVKCKDLRNYQPIALHTHPSMGGMQPALFTASVQDAGIGKVYGFIEPKRGMAVFNDVLVCINGKDVPVSLDDW